MSKILVQDEAIYTVPKNTKKKWKTQEDKEKEFKIFITNLQKEFDEKDNFIKRLQRSLQSFECLSAEVEALWAKKHQPEIIVHKLQDENSKLGENLLKLSKHEMRQKLNPKTV